MNSLYSLSGSVFGDYQGELNNGDLLALVDSNGQQVDYVDFNNKFPWPSAANGVSGDVNKGMSLQRVSWTVAGDKSYNWIAADPTPLASNTGSQTTPNPVLTSVEVTQQNQATTQNGELFPSLPITITAKVTPAPATIIIEYFTVNLYASSESDGLQGVTYSTVNVNAASSADPNKFAYTFSSGFPENTGIKYRVKVGDAVIAPRSNDAQKWFGFFVSPTIATSSDIYHLFVLPANWDTLWNNIKDGFYLDPQTCCNFNPNWGKEVYSVLGYKGQLIDVESQYQGSEFNRDFGYPISNWTAPGPSIPSPMLGLSWKIDLPEWADISGKNTLYLLKPRDVGCSYASWYVMLELAKQMGLPAADVNFARFHINGAFYMYSMDINYYSNSQVQNYIDKEYSDNCYDQSTEQVGFMYKAHGSACNGPAGPSNEG